MFRSIIVFFLIVATLTITAFLVFAQYYLSPIAKDWLEKQASATLGTKVTIKDLRIQVLPQLAVAMSGIKWISHDATPFEVNKAFLRIPLTKDLLHYKGSLEITVVEPRMQFDIDKILSAQPHIPPQGESYTEKLASEKNANLGVHLKIEKAHIRFVQSVPSDDPKQPLIKSYYDLDPANLELTTQSSSGMSELNLKSQAQIARSPILMQMPIQIHSVFSVQNSVLLTERTKLTISGIPIDVSGSQDFNTGKANWRATISEPDLTKLSEPFSMVRARQWKGTVSGSGSFYNSDGKNWIAKAHFEVANASCYLEHEQNQTHLAGPVEFNLKSQFSYYKKAKLDELKLTAVLDHALITHPDVISKGADTPMNVQMDLKTDQTLKISALHVQLGTLNAQFTGDVADSTISAPSRFNFNVAPVDLASLQKILPILAVHKMQGQMASQGSFDVDLKTSKLLNLNVDKLNLTGFGADIDYSSEDKKIKAKGPVKADIIASLKVHGKDISSGQIKVDADLDQTTMTFGDNFTKTPGQSLKTHLELTKSGSDLRFTNSKVTLLNSVTTVGGSVSNPTEPDFNLALENPKINLKELAPVLPHLRSVDAVFDKVNVTIVRQGSAVHGRSSVENAHFGGASLDQIIADKIRKFAKVETTGNAKSTEGLLKTEFTYAASVFNFSDIQILTPQKNELHAHGLLKLESQELDLSGTAYVATLAAGGDIKAANSDAQGRLVIPILIKGHISSPDFSLAPNAIPDMLKNTLPFILKRTLSGSSDKSKSQH